MLYIRSDTLDAPWNMNEKSSLRHFTVELDKIR